MEDNNILLEVKNLKKYFPIKKGLIVSKHVGDVKAVDDVSFYIKKGETFGLVGESGCGKSTTGRVVLRLIPCTGGEIRFKGTNILEVSHQEMRSLRRQMQIIFQDPYASLNPRMSVGEIIGEPLDIHKLVNSRKAREERIHELLKLVGLSPYHASRYPHEFSGGQRQRIGIARALAVEPELIIADEPVSALDVSIQAQVINLLQDLQQKFNLSYLFIAHGLNVVKHISQRVGVMYVGKLVEVAPSEDIYNNPLHPYTQALMSANPIPDPEIEAKRKRIILEGDVPSPVDPPKGCRFHTRCPVVMDVCKQEEPPLIQVTGHMVACHRVK